MSRNNRLAPNDRARIVGLLSALFLTLALAAQQSTNPWIIVFGCLLDAIVTLYLADLLPVPDLLQWLRDGPIRLLRWLRAEPIRLRVAAGLVLVLVVVPGVLPIWQHFGPHGPVPVAGCPQPAELSILTSPDSLMPTRELAERYAHETADPNQRQCPKVHTFVYAATTAATAVALASAWREHGAQRPLADLGPRPDVWLPDSTVDVRAVRTLADQAQVTPPMRSIKSIASSPIVVAGRALPPSSADTDVTWSRVIGSILDNSPTGLLAPDPQTSTTGLFAMSSYLRSAGYLRSADAAVSLTDARRREQVISESGGQPGDSSVALLCRYRGGTTGTGSSAIITSESPAVITSEQLWLRFASNRPLADNCPPPGRAKWAGVPAVAPADTPILDHPFVDFTWTAGTQRDQVVAFHQWLTGSAGRAALTEVDLQPARYDCAVLDGPSTDNPCIGADLSAMLNLYRNAQQPGRVLLAMDSSGSMGEATGSARLPRFTIASQAVVQALGQMGPRDEFGLWIFPGSAPQPSQQDAPQLGHQELVAIGAGNSAHRDAVVKALDAVRPAGGTPLYRTIITGLQTAAAGGSVSQPRALIVLTDGQDTSSGITAEDTRRKVAELTRTAGVRLFVIAMGDASCEGGANLQALTDAGHGGCFDAGPNQLPGIIAELFESLWKGR